MVILSDSNNLVNLANKMRRRSKTIGIQADIHQPDLTMLPRDENNFNVTQSELANLEDNNLALNRQSPPSMANLHESTHPTATSHQSNVLINLDTIRGPPTSSGTDLIVTNQHEFDDSARMATDSPSIQNSTSFQQDISQNLLSNESPKNNDIGSNNNFESNNNSNEFNQSNNTMQNRRFSLQEYNSYSHTNNGYHNEDPNVVMSSNSANNNETHTSVSLTNVSNQLTQPSSVLKKRPGRPKGSKNKPKDYRFSLTNTHPPFVNVPHYSNTIGGSNNGGYVPINTLPSQLNSQYERSSSRHRRKRQRLGVVKRPQPYNPDNVNGAIVPSSISAIDSHNSSMHHQQSFDVNPYYTANQFQVYQPNPNDVNNNHESTRMSPQRTSSNDSPNVINYPATTQELSTPNDLQTGAEVRHDHPGVNNVIDHNGAMFHPPHQEEFVTESLIEQNHERDSEFRSVRVLSSLPASNLFKSEIIERINSVAGELGIGNNRSSESNASCFLYCNSMDSCIERETLLAKNIVFITKHGFLSIVHQQIYVVQNSGCSKSLCTYVIHEHSLPICLVCVSTDNFIELL